MAEQGSIEEGTLGGREPASTALWQLIEAAREGDAEAYDRIMILHQHRVVSLAWRLLGNREDARDAAQETFLRIYKNLRGYDPGQDFAGWLYRIAVNVCRDLARKRKRQSAVSLEEEFAAGTIGEPASGANTEEGAVLAQQQKLLAMALETLTEKERLAIVLRDLQELPTDEVARILGSSPTTVRTQISTGRAKIRLFHERWMRVSKR